MAQNNMTLGKIQSIAVAYLAIWSISPPLGIDSIYRIIALGFAVIWIGIWVVRENPIVLDKNQLISMLFLFTVIGVTFISDGDFNGILKQISFFMLVVCFIMNNFYKNHWSELRWLVPLIMILFIVWNAKTTLALIDDPTIARRLVRNDESIYIYFRQGIGGYSLIYPQACIAAAGLMWAIRAFKYNKVYFIIGLIWFSSFVQLISKAGYSIAIFTTIAGAVLLFFYNGQSGLKAFAVAGIIFAALMLSILYLDDFREWLLEFFDGTAVAKKINDLVATEESGEAEGSIQARMVRYGASLKVIVQYPIIGALWRGNGGAHSGLLDVFAKYGLWGGYFFIKSFYSAPNYYKSKYENSLVKRMSNATLVCLITVSLLNSVTYAFYCVVLFVLPLIFEDVIRWEGIEDENTVDS